MPGIVIGEASSCSNPILPFFYQREGYLADILELSFAIYTPTGTVALYSADVDLHLCEDGGHKLGIGYYVAAFDPEAEGLVSGPYVIEWSYILTIGGPVHKAAYSFEVLSPAVVRTSAAYSGYISSARDELATWELDARQRAILRASREVERLTGRIFFPKYMEQLVSVRKRTSILFLDSPIIGISRMTVEGGNPLMGVYTVTDIGLSAVRIYNRHLDFLLSPDDRDNPKIQYVPVLDEAWRLEMGQTYFPVCAKGIKIYGVFGYTDPDGSPFGATPDSLADVVTALASRILIDPLGQDMLLQQPSRIQSAKTRDQSITFNSNTEMSISSTYSMTGDPRLDAMLAPYCRPWHVGSAGG